MVEKNIPVNVLQKRIGTLATKIRERRHFYRPFHIELERLLGDDLKAGFITLVTAFEPEESELRIVLMKSAIYEEDSVLEILDPKGLLNEELYESLLCIARENPLGLEVDDDGRYNLVELDPEMFD